MAVLCKNCAGRLIFNPASQKLECEGCGSFYSPEDVEDIYAEAGSKYYDTRVYTCSHCGAEVITSDSEVSTFCVYCGNPAIVFNRISKEYRPDGLVPFKITREQAIANIRKKFLKNPIVPQEIKDKCIPGNLRGIYVPYWIINAHFAEADWIRAEIKRGKHTQIRYYSRSGKTFLRNVPIDGSRILNDDTSRKLEPFYLEDAKDFDEDYLNGFYSNTSDLNYYDLRASAATRCHALYSAEVVKTIGMHANKVKIVDSMYWIDILDDPIYMMMPVWFFTFVHEGNPYTVLVNGQTGKVVGTMPWQKKRIRTIALSVFFFILVFVGFFFVGSMTGLLKYFQTFYMHAVVGLLATSMAFFTKGTIGLKRIFNNLKLTQSEEIFKFVKKRQE
jgi:DNA-directed RNA polymerase subunit RPC12/RpoP